MADRFEAIAETGLSERLLETMLAEHRRERLPRLETLWRYFRNPLEAVGRGGVPSGPTGGPRFRSAQEDGLPSRITGRKADGSFGTRREVVVENDIAWRLQTMVDFLVGDPVRIVSTAGDDATRGVVERVLDAVWEASGGLAMLQDAVLLGHVHGYVDFVVRIDEEAMLRRAEVLRAQAGRGDFGEIASLVRIEPVEPRRGTPVVSDADYRELEAYCVCFERVMNEVGEARTPSRESRVAKLFGRGRKDGVARDEPFSGAGAAAGSASYRLGGRGVGRRRTVEVVEVFGKGVRARYEDGALIELERSVLLPDAVPVVHVQNLSQPFRYEGLGEVEPLIPLQDELNTRLSDRANRVTLQSFRMYLAKRLDKIGDIGVGPGQVWTTDDPDADIKAFGGDAASPSESEHIEQIREAMDKASAVPPLASGVVRGRIGNLSSGNALRITLLSLLSKTSRKRVTYGAGIERVSRLVLGALDAAGVVPTRPDERGLRVVWPEAQALDTEAEVRVAEMKAGLGVPRERVLAELGYGVGESDIDTGVE
ncbi:MAG: phage portal protein [Planctomycetota bacterium]